MRRSSSILLLFAAAIGVAAPALWSPVESRDRGRSQDPHEPLRPSGFERRDVEDMDRKAEQRRQQRWDEQEARAKAKKQRKKAAPPAASKPVTSAPK